MHDFSRWILTDLVWTGGSLIERVRRWEPPFADSSWPTWTPPAGWSSPPSLPAWADE